MKKIVISVLSLATLLALAIGPALAVSDSGCCPGHCCGQTCCNRK